MSKVSVSLLTEYVPTLYRAKVLVVLSSLFWSIGALTEAFLAWAVLPTLGWRWFLIFSSFPVLILLVLVRTLPESPHYLLVHNRTSEAEDLVNLMLQSNKPELAKTTRLELISHDYVKVSVSTQIKSLA